MFYSSADFVKFTRKQANVVYAAFKRGDVKMTSEQVHHLYNCVGTDDMAFYGVCSFICESEYDLAQAVLDGKKVEAYEVEDVTRILVTEDNADEHPFYEVGEYVEYSEVITRYRVA